MDVSKGVEGGLTGSVQKSIEADTRSSRKKLVLHLSDRSISLHTTGCIPRMPPFIAAGENTELGQSQVYLLAVDAIPKFYCCIEIALDVVIIYAYSVSHQASSIIFELSVYILMRP